MGAGVVRVASGPGQFSNARGATLSSRRCPNETEREGYVPNIVCTCGALLHGHELVIPYAMSDYATSFATVSLDELRAAMK